MFHSMFMSNARVGSVSVADMDLEASELAWEAEVAAVNAGYDSPFLAAYNVNSAALNVANCYGG